MHQILNSRFGAKEVYNSNSVAAIAGTNPDMVNSAIIPGAKEPRSPIIPNMQQYSVGTVENSVGAFTGYSVNNS